MHGNLRAKLDRNFHNFPWKVSFPDGDHLSWLSRIASDLGRKKQLLQGNLASCSLNLLGSDRHASVVNPANDNKVDLNSKLRLEAEVSAKSLKRRRNAVIGKKSGEIWWSTLVSRAFISSHCILVGGRELALIFRFARHFNFHNVRMRLIWLHALNLLGVCCSNCH